MSNISKQGYINSIEESAAIVSKELDPEVVSFVYQRFGANNLESVQISDLPEVFNELYAIEADLR